MATSVELLSSFEQIAPVREEWVRWNWYPETDPDFVRIIVESRPEAKAPCVMVLRQRGVVQAMLIGRTEVSRLTALPALNGVIQPNLKILRVLYGGMLGDWRQENLDIFLHDLKRLLSRRNWHAIHFPKVSLRSPLWDRSKVFFSRLCCGSRDVPNKHWRANLPESYDKYYQSLDGRTRKNLNRHRKRIEREFTNLAVRCLDQPSDLETILTTSEAIIGKTYQKGFVTDWTSDEMQRRVSLWLSRGQLNACFLYLNGEACAYEHILRYRGGAYGMGTAYDPAFRQYSVGRYIQMKALEQIWKNDDPITSLDLGFGDAEYKRELCDSCDGEADLVLCGGSPVALWGNAMRTMKIRSAGLLRRTLKSTGLFSAIKVRWREHRRKRSQ